MLSERNIQILKIIVEEYLQTWEVLGSKLLLKKYDLGVSSATVRNDMAKLEELELVFQPYHSAGRLPTAKGIKAFVNYIMTQTPEHFLSSEKKVYHSSVQSFYDLAKRLSFEIAQKSEEIAFICYPREKMFEFSGTGKFLEQNHERMGNSIFSIIKMLEDKENFMSFLDRFKIQDGMNIYIGEEAILPYFKDYSIIIKKLKISDKETYIGIIGSLKMNYSFNISLVNGII